MSRVITGHWVSIVMTSLLILLLHGCVGQSTWPSSDSPGEGASKSVQEETLSSPKFKSSSSAIEIVPERSVSGSRLRGRYDAVSATPTQNEDSPEFQNEQPSEAIKITTSPGTGDELIQFNFDSADLTEVIRTLAEIMGLKYIENPDIQGKVTIHTAEGIPRKNLFSIFQRILEVNGVTAMRDGPLYRITQTKDSTRLPIGVRYDTNPETMPATEVVMTQVIPLKYASPADMIKVLTPFLSSGATIVANDDTKTLVIVDKGLNILKAMRLVKSFDIDLLSRTNYSFFFLQNADAEDAANVLQDVFSGSQPGQEVVKFVPIKRLNALLALSHNRTAFTQVEKLLGKIDAAGASSEPRIYVYFVKNGAAANLSALLSQVFGSSEGNQSSTPESKGLSQQTLYSPSSTGTSSSLQSQPSSTFGSQSTLASSSSASGLSSSYNQTPGLSGSSGNPLSQQRSASREIQPPKATNVAAGTSATLKNAVRITADEIRNALIIEATPGDFRTIENILNRIDVLPRQVLIEATIAEISLDDKRSLGTEWSYVRGGTFGNGLQTLTIDGTSGLTAVIGFNGRLKAQFNALMAKNLVNILSSPHVLASDNREARIDVSNEIPIASSQTIVTSTSPLVTTNVQYRDTGVMLSVTPHINERGLVTLDIYQEVSERAEDVLVAGVEYPSFFKRAVNTALTVKHGQTIVLGGLIRENKGDRKNGVPWFAEIPIIGVLFGSHTKSFNRTELIILLTPRVIINLEDVDIVTDSFEKKVKTISQTML